MAALTLFLVSMSKERYSAICLLSDVDERDEERAEDVGALPEAVGHRHASREVAPDLLELVAQDRIGDGVREAAYGAEERDAGLRKGVHLPAEHHEILDLHVMHEMQIAEEPAPGALLLHRLLGEAHRHDAARGEGLHRRLPLRRCSRGS